MVHGIVLAIGVMLNLVYAYAWLGPRGGDGPYSGLGNAMAMVAIAVLCAAVGLVLAGMLYARRAGADGQRGLVVLLVIYGLPVACFVGVLALNAGRNGY
jgi:hypothetical protein